jgi:hypothetical protein
MSVGRQGSVKEDLNLLEGVSRHMKHVMLRARRVVLLAVGVVGVSAAAASAAPLSNFNVDFTGSGQMLVDVYGANSLGGTDAVSQGSSSWDPIDFGSSSGYRYDGMAVFGRDTAGTSDDFVRYWFSRASTDTSYHWAMSNDVAALAPVDAIPNPEPGSMVLLGSGLLGLATVARRRFRQGA